MSLVRPIVQNKIGSLYLYRIESEGLHCTGLVGCYSLEEYDAHQIKRHELTLLDRENEQMNLLSKSNTQTHPILLTYKDSKEISQRAKSILKTLPLIHSQMTHGVTHKVWKISDPEPWVGLFKTQVSSLYIADGHHRTAAASQMRTLKMRQNSHHQGNEEYNFILGAAFPVSELTIFPYHRLVKNLGPLTDETLFKKLSQIFNLKSGKRVLPSKSEFLMYHRGVWTNLQLKNPSDVSFEFDADLLQETVLAPVFGILDPRTDSRLDFVGGHNGTLALTNRVDAGKDSVGFVLLPPKMDQVLEIADRGEVMPAKSTWIEPKLMDLFFNHSIL